jgi:hypothetical protein
MPNTRDIISKPAYWYMKAEEIRGQAERMPYETARRQMQDIALQYEALARTLEEEYQALLDPSFARPQVGDGSADHRNVMPLRQKDPGRG